MSKHILLILFLSVTAAHAQISPGDLTTSHSDLDGMSNCTKCHELGESPVKEKCLDCHNEIKKLMDQNRGYHSTSKAVNSECYDCHSEHNGREFDMLHFDDNSFNHSDAKYELIGKHAQIDCRKCHTPENIADDDLKKRDGSWLGLDTRCLSCHEDYHEKQLSDDCSNCHTSNSFKPADLFNHESADYKLTGRHLEVECIKCHQREGERPQKFTGLNYSSCSSCHADIHNSRFGNNCESCHVTASFSVLKNNNSFDHNKTAYQLLGKHLAVECENCHKGKNRTRPAYKQCIDCHSDYHKKEFLTDTGIKDCIECHTVYGFEISSFGMLEHNQTEYKLTGSHLAVSCNECHFKENHWTFRIDHIKCINCHDNVHGNTINAAENASRTCEGCHNTELWSRVTFNHLSTGFILEGKHLTTSCSDCHFSNKSEEAKRFEFYKLQTTCASCHNDIHSGQFIADYDNNCADCHDYNFWSPSKFDHSKSGFILDGAHKNVKCDKCHKKVIKDELTYTKYKFEDIKCSDCH